jgi:hypothetical protein
MQCDLDVFTADMRWQLFYRRLIGESDLLFDFALRRSKVNRLQSRTNPSNENTIHVKSSEEYDAQFFYNFRAKSFPTDERILSFKAAFWLCIYLFSYLYAFPVACSAITIIGVDCQRILNNLVRSKCSYMILVAFTVRQQYH